MPVNGHTVGRDVSLDIITPSGPLRLKNITAFDSKPNTGKQQIKSLNGKTTNLRFPNGWSGGFDMERQNSDVDDYFAQLEANYHNGLAEQSATITETIREVNGSVSQYRYTDVVLDFDNPGKKQADKSVTMRVAFEASRRLKIA